MLPSIESNSPMPSSRVAISLQRHSPGKVRIRRRPARNPSSSHAPAVPICDSPRSIRILNVNPPLAAQTYSRAFGPRFPPRVRARALGTFAGLVMGWFGRLGRGKAPAFGRRAAAMLAVALASSLLGAGAAARSATVRGIEMSRFGRIVLEFDRETKVQVSAVNGVLVLAFPEAAKIQGERLARELPSYVTQVRHDPDGRGLRVALTQGWRLNVLEAAEKVFIDLLPANWSGLLPALPPEVVDALARRAREAEARAGEEALRRREQRPRDVSLRVATLPTLTRLVLEPVGGVPVALKVEGHAAEVRIDAPATLKLGGAKTQIGAAIRSIESVVSGSSARLILVLRMASRRAAFARTMPSLSISRDRSSRSLRRKPGSNRRLSRLPRDRPRRRPRPPRAEPEATNRHASPPRRPDITGTVSASTKVTSDGLAIEFPFHVRTAAAAFERGGVATVVFQTQKTLEFDPLPLAAAPFAAFSGVTRPGRLHGPSFYAHRPGPDPARPEGRFLGALDRRDGPDAERTPHDAPQHAL